MPAGRRRQPDVAVTTRILEHFGVPGALAEQVNSAGAHELDTSSDRYLFKNFRFIEEAAKGETAPVDHPCVLIRGSETERFTEGSGSFVVGDKFVLLFEDQRGSPMFARAIKVVLERERDVRERGIEYLLYRLVKYVLVDNYFALMRKLMDELQDLEPPLLEGSTSTRTYRELARLRRELNPFERSLGARRRVHRNGRWRKTPSPGGLELFGRQSPQRLRPARQRILDVARQNLRADSNVPRQRQHATQPHHAAPDRSIGDSLAALVHHGLLRHELPGHAHALLARHFSNRGRGHGGDRRRRLAVRTTSEVAIAARPVMAPAAGASKLHAFTAILTALNACLLVARQRFDNLRANDVEEWIAAEPRESAEREHEGAAFAATAIAPRWKGGARLAVARFRKRGRRPGTAAIRAPARTRCGHSSPSRFHLGGARFARIGGDRASVMLLVPTSVTRYGRFVAFRIVSRSSSGPGAINPCVASSGPHRR